MPQAGRAGMGRTGRRLMAGAILSAILSAMAAGAVQAQSAANPNDQPTAGTLPPGTDTVKGDGHAAHRPTGDVSAPSAIRPSTTVVPSGKGRAERTNPLDHLSDRFKTRSGTDDR